jgi:hypothetical protein
MYTLPESGDLAFESATFSFQGHIFFAQFIKFVARFGDVMIRRDRYVRARARAAII